MTPPKPSPRIIALIGRSPRVVCCAACQRCDEVRLGTFAGAIRECPRCGIEMVAGVIAQGPGVAPVRLRPRPLAKVAPVEPDGAA